MKVFRKKSLFLVFILLTFVYFDGNSQSSVEEMMKRMDQIHNQNQRYQKHLIMKNKEHQRKILARLNKFFKMVENFDGKLKLQPPVHPGYARKIKNQRYTSSIKRTRKRYAYLKEPYRLRSKPADRDKNYIIKLRRNTRVQVIYQAPADPKIKSISKKWCFVKYGRKQGFIPLNLLAKKRYRSFLQKERLKTMLSDNDDYLPEHLMLATDHRSEITGGALIQAQYNFKKDMYKVTAGPYLNIRDSASRYGSIVGRVYKNSKVEVIDYSTHKEYIEGMNKPWAKIKYGNSIGWVFSGYLEKIEAGSVLNPEDLVSGLNLYVKSDTLRIRDEPSDEGCVITSIPHKEKVTITEVGDNIETIGKMRSKWVQIEYEDFEGWVYGGFLSKTKKAYIKTDSISHQFVFPVKGYRRITSPYGYRTLFGKRQFHRGIDVGAPTGAPVLAAADGLVVYCMFNRNGFGNLVMIDHDDNKRTMYAHGSKLLCRKGATVKAGQTIMLIGSTGFSTGAHLHFEVRVENRPVNPNTYLHPRQY